MADRAEVVIDAPVERVFAFMDDVRREAEWQPNIVEAWKEPAGPTRVGTRKCYASRFLGKRIENRYVVERFEPPRAVRYRTTPDSALQAVVDVRFHADGARTRVVVEMEGSVSGPLRLIPRRILEKAQREEMQASLATLKRILEEEG